MAIHFFSEDVSFVLTDRSKTINWINKVLIQEGKRAESLNYIFCSDIYLLELNKQYLNHATLTDIITFDNSEGQDQLLADIYISVERIKDNAYKLNIPFTHELHRVMIHGILHLIGYNDKTPSERMLMREKEDACLSLR